MFAIHALSRLVCELSDHSIMDVHILRDRDIAFRFVLALPATVDAEPDRTVRATEAWPTGNTILCPPPPAASPEVSR